MVLDFGLLATGLFPNSDASGQGMNADPEAQIVWNDVGIGIVPIGAIVAWAKTQVGTPPLLPNFVECNGQVLADGDSPLNGLTIPDLNGDNQFLRGNATSGATGGAASAGDHTHSLGGGSSVCGTSCVAYNSATTSSAGGHDNRPPFMDVVWIIRTK